jgi:hypothetical protein
MLRVDDVGRALRAALVRAERVKTLSLFAGGGGSTLGSTTPASTSSKLWSVASRESAST